MSHVEVVVDQLNDGLPSEVIMQRVMLAFLHSASTGGSRGRIEPADL